MSDPTQNPIDYLHTKVLEITKEQKRLKEWIDFMQDAGENVEQALLKYRENEERLKRWKAALAAHGKPIT